MANSKKSHPALANASNAGTRERFPFPSESEPFALSTARTGEPALACARIMGKAWIYSAASSGVAGCRLAWWMAANSCSTWRENTNSAGR